MNLHGKTAIVTGGGTGIGKAIALALADAGAYVAICGRRESPLQQTLAEMPQGHEKNLYAVVDVSTEQEVMEFVQEVLLRFGSVDILVNNAAIATSGSVMTTSENVWDETLCIDLKSVYLMSQAVLSHMIKQESGHIINITSIAGLVAFSSNAAYAAAKGAVISLTRQMALDLGKNFITVNAIAPGYIETDMTREYLKDKKNLKTILAQTPIGRIGRVEDIAHLTLFLASDKADFITGQTFVVDGGWTIQ